MKTNKITLYFIMVTLVVSFILGSFFYFFTKEKDSALNSAIQTYRENSTKLIADKVYEDLLIENLLEAQRKLILLKESKIIDNYQIIKKDQFLNNELKYCETIFFDKTGAVLTTGIFEVGVVGDVVVHAALLSSISCCNDLQDHEQINLLILLL